MSRYGTVGEVAATGFRRLDSEFSCDADSKCDALTFADACVSDSS